MGKKSIPPRRAHGDGGFRLRERAVLYEDSKARRPAGQRINLSGADPETLSPDLTAYIAERAGFVPRTRSGSGSDAAPRIARLKRMRASHGPLVLLTLSLPSLDSYALKSRKTADSARKIMGGILKLYARRATAYEVAVQRGVCGGTHAHIVLPLDSLSKGLQAAVQAAPSGQGGGVEYLSERLHGVLIDEEPEDLERVGGYLSRDPDARFDLPADHPAFLQAHNEELQRKREHGRSPNLSWYKSA